MRDKYLKRKEGSGEAGDNKRISVFSSSLPSSIFPVFSVVQISPVDHDLGMGRFS
jgi:hypothetical protein